MPVKGSEAEGIILVCLLVVVKVVVDAACHSQHGFHSPSAVINMLRGLDKLGVILEHILVVEHNVHLVDGVGGYVAGYKVELVVDGGGIKHNLRPPRHFEIKVIKLCQLCTVAVHSGESHCSGVCGHKIEEIAAGCICIANVVCIVFAVAIVLTLDVDPVKLNAHLCFYVCVTQIDSVIDKLAVGVFNEELGLLNVVPPKNGNLCAAEVKLVGKRTLEIAVFVVGAFGGSFCLGSGCGSLG